MMSQQEIFLLHKHKKPCSPLHFFALWLAELSVIMFKSNRLKYTISGQRLNRCNCNIALPKCTKCSDTSSLRVYNTSGGYVIQYEMSQWHRCILLHQRAVSV